MLLHDNSSSASSQVARAVLPRRKGHPSHSTCVLAQPPAGVALFLLREGRDIAKYPTSDHLQHRVHFLQTLDRSGGIGPWRKVDPGRREACIFSLLSRP
jgi:hypothetical protein